MADDLDPSQLVTAFAFGASEDGRVVQVECRRRNGKVAYLQFEFEDLAAFVLNLEKAMGEAFKLQQAAVAGSDPKLFYPSRARRVTELKGTVAADGTPVLVISLGQGMDLDLSLNSLSIPELIRLLQSLEDARQEGLDRTN